VEEGQEQQHQPAKEEHAAGTGRAGRADMEELAKDAPGNFQNEEKDAKWPLCQSFC
jgi:hypothetical protein